MLKESLKPSVEMQKWFDKKWAQFTSKDTINVHEFEKMLPSISLSLFQRSVEAPSKLAEQIFGDLCTETLTNDS